jgi:hypothetical protein
MRLPSTKTLDQAFPGHGRRLREALESNRTVREHPAAIARRDECLNPPSLLDQRLHTLNAIAETHGVEYIAHRDDTMRDNYGLEYLNTGDTYIPTLIYDHSKDRWIVGCWGDIVERNPNHYR